MQKFKKVQYFIPLLILIINSSSQILNLQQNQIDNQQQQKPISTFQKIQTKVQSLSSLRISQKQLDPITLPYGEYLKQYKNPKTWPTQKTFSLRQQAYTQNLQTINAHNKDPSRSFSMSLSSLTDIPTNQFQARYVSGSPIKIPMHETVPIQKVSKNQTLPFSPSNPSSSIASASFSPSSSSLPSSSFTPISWQCHDTPIHDQLTCNSGYILASLDAIQITSKIYGKKLQKLSAQQLLSCDNVRGYGCQGGYLPGVFQYAVNNGIGVDSMYGMDDVNGEKKENGKSECRRDILGDEEYRKAKVFANRYKKIKSGDCLELIKQLQFRPLIAAVSSQMLQKSLQYSISSPSPFPTPSSLFLDHTVLILGYGPKGFLIKNSKGKNWGLGGYAYVGAEVGICYKAFGVVMPQQKQGAESNIKIEKCLE